MIVDIEAALAGDAVLALLDATVDELFHLAAVQTDNVVVVITPIQLEYGHAVFEVMTGNQARGLKLGQHAVYRGEPDVLIGTEQRLVNVFRRLVPGAATPLEDFENFQPRQRDLQPGIAQILAFQLGTPRVSGNMADSTMTAFTMRTSSETAAPRRRTTRLSTLALLGIAALSAGCLYRMPIQQGNFLDVNQVAQLEPGMTRPQVSFLLGTAMVPNGFNNDRWDYYYYIKVGRKSKDTDTKRLTVWFKDDKVDHVDRSDAPVSNAEQTEAVEKAAAAEIGAPKVKPPPVTKPPEPPAAGPAPATP